MSALGRDWCRRTWWGRGAVIVAALLTLAAGLCLLDGDEAGAGGHTMGPDLCLSMVAMFLAVASFARPFTVGWPVSLSLAAAPYAVTRHTPEPPPKPASLV